MLDGREIPLKLQLNHSQKKPYIELRLLQVRDVLAPPMMSSTPKRGGVVGGMVRTDSEDSLEGDGNNIVPKEEGEKGEGRGRERKRGRVEGDERRGEVVEMKEGGWVIMI